MRTYTICRIDRGVHIGVSSMSVEICEIHFLFGEKLQRWEIYECYHALDKCQTDRWTLRVRLGRVVRINAEESEILSHAFDYFL